MHYRVATGNKNSTNIRIYDDSTNFAITLIKISYKLEIPKNIYQLAGQILKREIVNIFKDQNVSFATIYRTIKECQQGIPCVNLPKSERPKCCLHGLSTEW